jgi:hypothetical protein
MTESGIASIPNVEKSFKMILPDFVAVYPILLKETQRGTPEYPQNLGNLPLGSTTRSSWGRKIACPPKPP